MEEIQKSIKLINFSDSIFDVGKSDNNQTNSYSMLKSKQESFLKSKQVPFVELLRIYFTEGSELFKEICVVYYPLSMSENESEFRSLIEEYHKRQESMEMKCFGRILTRRGEEILEFHDKIFKLERLDNICVLSKGISSQIDLKCGFDAKRIARTISLMEAIEYIELNPKEFYGCSENSNVKRFIAIFNNLTNFLISEILSSESEKERNLVVKRILKMAKELAAIGAMNSLKSCLAALESNSVHRLELINLQSAKYKKRFRNLSVLMSSEGNFEVLRSKGSLIPWLGLVMKDFVFIREKAKDKGRDVCLPLAVCLRKLMNSISEAKDSCVGFVNTVTIKEKSDAAVMKKWLLDDCETEIVYSAEELQYQRSLEIKKIT